MSKAGSRCALVVGALLGVASASSSSPWQHQGSPGALDDATLSKLRQFHAQRSSEEEHTTEAASNPAAHGPAGKIVSIADGNLTVASAKGPGEKLLSTSQREALWARLKDARTAAGDLEGKPAPRPPHKMPGTYITANDITEAFDNGGRRKLQATQTCADGSGVTVTSAAFPLLEGCLEESEDFRFANNHVEFSSDTGLIIAGIAQTETTTEEVWLAVFGNIAAIDFAFACRSQEEASTVHPSEATWICTLADGSEEVVTDATFRVDCGCDGGVSSTEITPVSSEYSATTVGPTPPTGGSDCAADESLGVTSTAFPLMEGCYEEVEIQAGGELEYASSTGVIIAIAPDETALWMEYWYALYDDATAPEGVALACFSAELASTVHPSDATWACVDVAGEFYSATGTDFVVDCGCDGVASATPTPTTSSATTAPPIGRGLDFTPAPTVTSSTPTSSTSSSPGAVGSPSAGGTPDACTDASVTVTSSEFPLLEGCLTESDIFEGGEIAYVGGLAGLIYEGTPEGETVPHWFALYLNGTTSDTDAVFACASLEATSIVHPADATWVCDFGTNVGPATPATFSVECGCDGVDVGTGGGEGSMSTTTTMSSADTPAPTATDRDFGNVGDTTPAPADADDDTGATQIPIEETDDDAEDASPGTVGSTDGAAGRSLSAWSAAAGAGATGVIAAVMTLAMGRL